MISYEFIQYLDAARIEALPERESEMFSLRYGISSGSTHTLADIGNLYGLSRERIRQLLNRSQRRIISKAKRQLKAGQIDSPCAELSQFLTDIIKPEEPNSGQRLLEFIEEILSFMRPTDSLVRFIAQLAYPSRLSASEDISFVTTTIRTQMFEKSRELAKSRCIEKSCELAKLSRIEKVRKLLSRAMWPKKVRKLSLQDIERLKRHRNVSWDGDGKAGIYFSNKLNRNVQYESELELHFFQQIDLDDNIITYQEQPLAISYENEGEKLTYYPDALLIFKDYRAIIVEIKPVFLMALHENLVKWASLKHFSEKYGLGLLITDGTYTLQQIQRHKSKSEYVAEILSYLENGPINWEQYKQIKQIHCPNRDDFVAMILKNGLLWQLGPFKLSLA
jgi:hypothetical protein